MTTVTYQEFFRLVRTRAFEIYEQKTDFQQPGDQLSDWLAAEREISSNRLIAITFGICS